MKLIRTSQEIVGNASVSFLSSISRRWSICKSSLSLYEAHPLRSLRTREDTCPRDLLIGPDNRNIRALSLRRLWLTKDEPIMFLCNARTCTVGSLCKECFIWNQWRSVTRSVSNLWDWKRMRKTARFLCWSHAEGHYIEMCEHFITLILRGSLEDRSVQTFHLIRFLCFYIIFLITRFIFLIVTKIDRKFCLVISVLLYFYIQFSL